MKKEKDEKEEEGEIRLDSVRKLGGSKLVLIDCGSSRCRSRLLRWGKKKWEGGEGEGETDF
jgi:hypothetical protein